MKKLLLLTTIALFTMVSATAQTVKYQDFTLKSDTGKDLSLSSVVTTHKYTLLDFWASWCGPCVGEFSFLKQAYENYYHKGFDIFAVSLDTDAMQWQSMIRKNDFGWHQVSSLEGFKCPVARLYGVRSIPRNLLIDSKGNVVAENLRQHDLLEKLAELLK